MAVVVAYTAARGKEPNLIVWRIALAAFAVQCAFDVGYGLVRGELSARWVTENVVGNLAGSVLLAIAVITLFIFADFLYTHAPVGKAAKLAVA